MKKTPTFITTVVNTAAKEDIVMPWARGARRAAFIARREGLVFEQKTA
jgi:hypothetical protein